LIRETAKNVSGVVVVAENVKHFQFLKMYTTLLKGKDKLFGYNALLLNGKVIVRERPAGSHHEATSAHMNCVFANYMGRMEVLVSGGHTRFQYGKHSSLEADSCFFNRHIPHNDRVRDRQGEKLPSILVEINSSESYWSTDEIAQVYLDNEATRIVVSIKLVVSHADNAPPGFSNTTNDSITEMYFILYRARDRELGATRVNPHQVISFGACAGTDAVDDILRHTQVDPARFTGVGRTDGVQNDSTPDSPPFQVIIDAEDLWYDVPDTSVPDIERLALKIDLFEVITFLREMECSV
jgi:hypothetical protein